MDWFNKLMKTVDHNRGAYLGPLVAILVVVFVLVGCTSTTPSLMVAGEKVERAVFNSEIVTIQGEMAAEQAEIQAAMIRHNLKLESLQEKIEIGYNTLAEADLRTTKFIEFTGALATQIATGGISTAGIIGSLITLGSLGYGAGKGYDNRRKDNKIMELRAGKGSGTAT